FEVARLLLEHGAHPNVEVESSADTVSIAIMNGDRRMLELLGSRGATWEIGVRLGGTLTYEEIVAAGIRPSVKILAGYGDVQAAAARFAADPALADDPEALRNAVGSGHEEFVRLLLRYQPD